MVSRRSVSSFSAITWTAFLAAAFYLLAWTPIFGFWVESHWKKIPCQVSEKQGSSQFVFEMSDVQYFSTRMTLWNVKNVDPVIATQQDLFIPNAECYVRASAAGKPAMAVLKPRAGPERGVLIDRVAILILVLGVCVAVEFRFRRGRSSRKEPSCT